MIIQEHQLIQMFEPQENNKTAIYAFWVLHKAIIPHINNESLTAFPGRKLIAKVCKLSLPTVDKCLEFLEGQKIIKIKKRYDEKTKIHKSNIYSIETDLLKTVGKLKSKEVEEELQEPSQPSRQGVVNPVDKGSQSNLQGVVNPVDTNLQEEINLQEELTKLKKEKKEKFDAETYLENLELDLEIKQNLKAWLEVRKIKRSATTQNGLDLQIKNLTKHPKETQIKMIQNSVMNGWTGIFELKPVYQPATQTFTQNQPQFKPKAGNLSDEQLHAKWAGFYTEASESVMLAPDPIPAGLKI